MDSTSPAKSQPQHNFDLPNLKWKTGGNSSGSSHSRRRPTKSPAPSASLVRRSPLHDSVSAPPPRLMSPLLPPDGSPARGDFVPKQIPICVESFNPPSIFERYWMSALVSGDPGRLVNGHCSLEAEGSKKSNNHRNFASGTMRPCPLGIDQNKPRESGVNLGNLGKNKNPVEVNPLEEPLKILHKGEYCGKNEVQGEGKTANEETRVWELRPRNPKHKTHNTSVGDKEKKEKDKEKERKKLSLSIPLSKAEIEEDIYAITGSKPSRRPKKRARNIQKNLDSLFPGLWLVSITPESYKVSEHSMKG